MRQLDLFGAVEEKKPESNIKKVADADLHVAHVEEMEKKQEETLEQEVEMDQKTNAQQVIQAEEFQVEEKVATPQINEVKEIKHWERPTEEIKPKKDAPKQEPKESKRGRKSYKEMEAEVENVELPDDEILFQKQYYSISKVAEW